MSEFYRVNKELDIFTLLVQSNPLFGPPLPKNKINISNVKIKDLGGEYFVSRFENGVLI